MATSVSNQIGSESIRVPSMSNSTASGGECKVPLSGRPRGRSGVEVLRFRMMDHDGVGRLLGVQLILLGQTHADPARFEQLDDLRPVLEVRAGAVAEGEAGAAVFELEHAVERRRILCAESELG